MSLDDASSNRCWSTPYTDDDLDLVRRASFTAFDVSSTMAERHHTKNPLPDFHRHYEGDNFRISKALIREDEFGGAAEDLEARTWEVIRKCLPGMLHVTYYK